MFLSRSEGQGKKKTMFQHISQVGRFPLCQPFCSKQVFNELDKAQLHWASLVARQIKNPPAMREVKWRWRWKLLSCVESLRPHKLSPWNSLGQNTGVGSLSLLQGIFSIQGSNPGLPHCRQIHYQLNHKGSSRILEWVAYPFSTGSSQPRNRTRVSCNTGRFSTNWAMKKGDLGSILRLERSSEEGNYPL